MRRRSCYFQNKLAGDPRGPCGRPGARGLHVGDPCCKSFWKLASKDRFAKLKDFALTCARHLETHTCVRVRTFRTLKQVTATVKTEIEWQTKHWTIGSDLLPLPLVLLKEKRYCQRSLNYRHPTDRDV